MGKRVLQGNIEYILKEISNYFSSKKLNLSIQVLENIKVGSYVAKVNIG